MLIYGSVLDRRELCAFRWESRTNESSMYVVFICKPYTRTLQDELVKLRIKGYGDVLHVDKNRVPYRASEMEM
jgi:hypothetical protein